MTGLNAQDGESSHASSDEYDGDDADADAMQADADHAKLSRPNLFAISEADEEV